MGVGPDFERGGVMPIVFNLRGMLFLALGFGAAYAADQTLGEKSGFVFGLPSSSVAMFLSFGVVALACDLVYRQRKDRTGGVGRFFDPQGGGQLMILPVWLWGLLAVGFGGYHVAGEAWVRAYYAGVLIREVSFEKTWLGSADELEFSSDGRVIAVVPETATASDALFLDVATGQPAASDISMFRFRPTDSEALSKDGGRRVTWTGNSIAVGSDSGEPRQLELPRDCGYGCVHAVAMSPDGSLVAAVISWDEIVVWDAQSLEKLGSFRKYGGSVDALAISPDGKVLASVSSGDLQYWKLDSLRGR